MKGRIIIYSITGCPHCMRAKNKLQKLGLPYTDINLDIYPNEREAVANRSRNKTVPQIFFNNIHVGGFDEFDKLSETEMQKLQKEIEENEATAEAPQIPDPGTAKLDPAGELGEEMRKMILKLYGAFLSDDGKRVDYVGIGGSDEFELYKGLARELQRVRLDGTSKEERLAFFINIYNALVIHGFIDKGSPTNIWQRAKFFNTTRYVIAGSSFSLQDIENGVLRGNKKGIGQFFLPFGKSDPRLTVALDTAEPMIHFALVCGAKSCPPIKTYSTENVYKQLELATQSFLEGEGCEILETSRPPRVRLSKLLTWYRSDFGESETDVLQWVHQHMGECEKKNKMGKVLEGPYKLEYMSYDWSINSH